MMSTFPHWLAWLLGIPMLTLIAIKAFKAGRAHAVAFKKRRA